MERNRLLELALEELQRQKVALDQEMESLRKELKGTGSVAPETKALPATGVGRGRKRTAAERKAHSILMKRIWAARKAKAAKPAAVPANAKKAEANNARSLAMKEAWKKRHAAAAAKTA